MSVLMSIGASLIAGWFKKSVAGGVGEKVIEAVVSILKKSDDGQLAIAKLNAETSVAMKKEETAQLSISATSGTERQKEKMSQTVFWVLIGIYMGPPAMMLWSVFFYNVFWWNNGIWPQSWSIAEFPPSIKPWVEKSIDWLYDPISIPLGVGSAVIAGRFVK